MPDQDDEGAVINSLRAWAGANVVPAGERIQSYDLEIKAFGPLGGIYLRPYGLVPGKYEVKSLWRAKETHSFDRRFKVGRRGEEIYGKRDAQLKSFALALETEIDSIIEHAVADGKRPDRTFREFVEEVHGIVDMVLRRKHSKALLERIDRLAHASLRVPTLTFPAKRVIEGIVQPHDIVRGFGDLAGIFLVAGPSYSLITGAEVERFLAFDSASSEGPKLRYLGTIPSDPKKKERKSAKSAAKSKKGK